MSLALRPAAVRLFLLLAGVVLGIAALVTVVAAATHTSTDSFPGGDSTHVTARGVMWR
jgi:hypothetical protein